MYYLAVKYLNTPAALFSMNYWSDLLLPGPEYFSTVVRERREEARDEILDKNSAGFGCRDVWGRGIQRDSRCIRLARAVCLSSRSPPSACCVRSTCCDTGCDEAPSHLDIEHGLAAGVLPGRVGSDR